MVMNRKITTGVLFSVLALLTDPLWAKSFCAPSPLSVEAPEASRQASQQSLQNLEALAKAYGYLRFFHPSDTAAHADWDDILLKAIPAVEGVQTPGDLAITLQRIFRGVAPTAQFLVAGETPKPIPRPREAVGAVRWVHMGFGLGEPAWHTFHSERQYENLERIPPDWTHPGQFRVEELGAGLRLAFCTVVFIDTKGATLPRDLEAGVPSATPTGGRNPLKRDHYLRAGITAWNILEHFHPCLYGRGIDWKSELRSLLAGLGRAENDRDGLRALKRMIAAAKDGHAFILGPGGDNQDVAVPLRLAPLGERLFVERTGEKARQLVPVGSELLAMDGKPVASLLKELKPMLSAGTPGSLEAKAALDIKYMGDQKERAGLTLRTPDGSTRDVIVPRCFETDLVFPGLRPAVQELRPGVWYANLCLLSDTDLNQTMPTLAKARGIIFDLRERPLGGADFLGNLSDVPLLSPPMDVPVFSEPDRATWTWRRGSWKIEPATPRLRGRIAFLADGGTISYPETCLAIIEAYHLGDIVGSDSAGSNGDAHFLDLSDGYTMCFTGLRLSRHNGSPQFGIGIHPTVPVQRTPQGLKAGKDELLERALKLMP
jgi:hypothetical protein